MIQPDSAHLCAATSRTVGKEGHKDLWTQGASKVEWQRAGARAFPATQRGGAPQTHRPHTLGATGVAQILLLSLALLSLSGGEGEPVWKQSPPQVKTANAEQQRRFRSLFDPDQDWPLFDVAWLRSQGEAGVGLLANRLCYPGKFDPFLPGDPPPANAPWPAWQRHDHLVRLGILREFRWGRVSVPMAVYETFLSQPRTPDLVVSALFNCQILDPAQGQALALRLVDPQDHQPLPGSRDPLVRQAVLAFLAGEKPGPALQRALVVALATAEGGELFHALEVANRLSYCENSTATLERLLDRQTRAPLSGDDRLALVLVLRICPTPPGAPSIPSLTSLLLGADRDLACAAATLFQRLPDLLPANEHPRLITRIRACSDLATQRTLLDLLARVQPQSILGLLGPGPWAELAEHRQAVLDWAERKQ